jgi:hypothetical protein
MSIISDNDELEFYKNNRNLKISEYYFLSSRAYLIQLITSYNRKKISDIFEISVNYSDNDDLYEALGIFDKILRIKGYRIRKIKVRELKWYPGPDAYKDLVITKLGYTEGIFSKMYYWWKGYEKFTM